MKPNEDHSVISVKSTGEEPKDDKIFFHINKSKLVVFG